MDTESTSGATTCAQCGNAVGDDAVRTDDVLFCRSCFNELSAQVEQAVAAQGQNVNYAGGILGGVLGGALGALVWWGFTVVTKIAFGLIAVVIGIAVGKGVTLLSGNKRSMGLQLISVLIAAVSFFYASYLVNRSFVLQAVEERGEAFSLTFLPSVNLMYEVIALDFGVFDIVFLAIVLWQAWKIPAPFKLAT